MNKNEILDTFLSGIAQLPNHFGVMVFIVFIIAGISVATPIQLELMQAPILNGISAAIAFSIVVSFAKIWTARTGGVSAGIASGINASKIPIPDEEIMRFATHEAGHILSLKLFPAKPQLVTAYVRKYVSNPNGNVYYKFDAPLDRDYSWAHMLNSLAGQIAESVVNGDYKIGSESDNVSWGHQAKQHLNSGFSNDLPWFSVPENKAEAELNSATLGSLRKIQIDQLQDFMMKNKQLLKSTAQRLIEVDKIETEEAISIIEIACAA